MPRHAGRQQLRAKPASQANLDIGVTVISFNHKQLLERCLRAVKASVESANVTSTIVVLDNASHDGSAGMVGTLFPDIELIEHAAVRDFAVNQNELFKFCEDSCRYVLMLNDDTMVAADTIGRLVAAMDRDDRIAAIGPKLVYADGTFQTAGERLPSWGYHFLRPLGAGRLMPSAVRFRLGGRDAGGHDGEVIREVGYIAGACMLVRSDALRDVGHLDERFRMYGEDADWCSACWQRGWKICAVPAVSVIHNRRQSWSSFSAIERERSMFTYLRKHNVGPLRLGLLKALLLLKCWAQLAAINIGARLGIASQDDETIATLRALTEVGVKA